MNKKVKDEEKKDAKKKIHLPRKPRTPRAFAPSWTFPIRTPQIFTEEVGVRRLEYLDSICELSGSNEGNELESLSNLTHEQYKNIAYEENGCEFEETDGDFNK